MAKKEEIPTLIVGTKVKERIKGHDIRSSSDFMDSLNKRVDSMIDNAVKRAKENKRGTVKPCDL